MAEQNENLLKDHKLHKKKLIPPLAHMLGGLKEVSWVKQGLPELLWIGLLNYKFGVPQAVRIIDQFTKECVEGCSLEEKPYIASSSSFNFMDSEDKQAIARKLSQTKLREDLLNGLAPLFAYYPECPLSFLFSAAELKSYITADNLELLKQVLTPLFYREEKQTVFAQATFFWLGVRQGKILIAENLSLAQFPEIEKYPDTELSRIIASGVRATTLALLGELHEKFDGVWPNYFWNRGIEISPCSFGE